VRQTQSHYDEEIIELLKRLGTLKAEYPVELLAARRAAFVAQIDQLETITDNPDAAPGQDPMIELLQELKPLAMEYPPDLLAARRAVFLAQIEERNRAVAQEEVPSQQKVIELLESLRPVPVEYPSELLSARRAAFIAQIQQQNSLAVQETAATRLSQDRRVFKLLERLKAIEIEYPLKLWTARRSRFVAKMRDGRMSVLDALRSAVQSLFHPGNASSEPMIRLRRTSLVIAGMLLATVVGSLIYGNRQPLTGMIVPTFSEGEVSHPSPVAAAPTSGEVAAVICKPGYVPPLCLAQEFDKSRDLTFPGNGLARPAVAKDTLPGYSRIHQPAYVNDGLYGSGASWISNSAYSWIKIDLGKVRSINTVTFGRDRLGNFNDGDPGQFIIAVAVSDDVYANGNSRNDFMEYTEVYNSDKVGFDGVIAGAETIQASFELVKARYIKITFENARTAVDEIEVFMLQPSDYVVHSTQRPRDTMIPPSLTPRPTNTFIPSRTPTAIPTNTFVPTSTATPRPTITPRPTDTDVPTDTPEPPTDTPEPPPTDTPEPPPTDTQEPPPTDTPEPPPTTVEQSTSTVEPLAAPTDTPEVAAP